LVFKEMTNEDSIAGVNKMFQGRLYSYKAVKSAFKVISYNSTVIFVENGYHKSVVICVSNYQTVFYKIWKQTIVQVKQQW